jgi:hypothetical protein
MNIKYLTLLLALTQLTIPQASQFYPGQQPSRAIQSNRQQPFTQQPNRQSYWSRTYNYIKNTPKRLCILYHCRRQLNEYKPYSKINPYNTLDKDYYSWSSTSRALVECGNRYCNRYMH